jgi:hypothetical protein
VSQDEAALQAEAASEAEAALQAEAASQDEIFKSIFFILKLKNFLKSLIALLGC